MQFKIGIFFGLFYYLNVVDGHLSELKHEDDHSDTITKIDKKLKELEMQVVQKAKVEKSEMESKLWGLHDQLENRIRDVARHLEHDCRKRALSYLSDALDEVERNGQVCRFAKSLADKMKDIEEEAKSVIAALRVEAQNLKLRHIPCLNRNVETPYCKKVSSSLDKLSLPAKSFISKAENYFSGDYDRFLVECFDKTAFDMKVQAGIVESQKCKGV